MIVLRAQDADVTCLKVTFGVWARVRTKIKIPGQNITLAKVIAIGHKDLFGARRIAIDAPGGRTFIVADSYGKPAVIGSRHFDDFIGFRTLQMQLRAPAGERRFFALNQDVIPTILVIPVCWSKKMKS